MLKKYAVSACLAMCLMGFVQANSLPQGFVYLKEVDPSIQQDMRYAGYHNFMGRPIKAYKEARCILTMQAAVALHQVQTELLKQGYSLKVYDCYRPQTAVNDFAQWSQDAAQQKMKAEFYPHVNKADVFKLGYVAYKSGHTRGSTIDLTIVKMPLQKTQKYTEHTQLVSCEAPYTQRFHDGSIDMGTGFDCFSEMAHSAYANLNSQALANQAMFKQVMEKYGFQQYENEWWHFTLKNEPFAGTYFDFPV